jgi:penicillin-insensitive murein endopeptidase
MKTTLQQLMLGLITTATVAASLSAPAFAIDADKPARELFGGVTLPSRAPSAPYGFYAKGCQAGAVAIPTDGPTWQAMRLSRNRRWGQPQMISLIERLSKDAAANDGWPGLLIGDISQPRGGPMMNGHASHQIGLDADVWLTPMPSRTLTKTERDNMPFTTMLQADKFLTVDPKRWTAAHARLIMRAASYPQVERIFVNPAIKKKLCESWTGDRTDMGKVRPMYGHDSHFHIRIKCPQGAANCKPQAAVTPGDGCDKSLAWWFTKEPWAAPKKDPDAKPVVPRYAKMADLPKACGVVLLDTPAASERDATYGGVSAVTALAPVAEAPESLDAVMPSRSDLPLEDVPMPKARPAN